VRKKKLTVTNTNLNYTKDRHHDGLCLHVSVRYINKQTQVMCVLFHGSINYSFSKMTSMLKSLQ